jgi:hypothetical protein
VSVCVNSCRAVTSRAVVSEAADLCRFLLEVERGKVGGSVELAIYHASQRYGIETGTLKSLRYRWRDLTDVSGTTLERLRQAFEYVHERARRVALLEQELEGAIESEYEHY